MIVALLAAASVAAAPPPSGASAVAAPSATILQDASHAIDVGRLKEAKLLIGRAVSAGFGGTAIERLSADLAFASGKYQEALSGYQHVAASPGKQQSDCEKGAMAALKIGKLNDAKPLVECAVTIPGASWRAWNARGVLADSARDWALADQSYAQAHAMAPDEASIANNQGWSMLLRGNWAAAAQLFAEAAHLDPKSQRIANNLELANAAVAGGFPQKRPGESDRQWAARLNDAGVAAELLGDKGRAIAAFTQALDASPVWYDRASNNLKALGQN